VSLAPTHTVRSRWRGIRVHFGRNRQFPEKGRRSGGATPTTGTFRGRNNEFASGKDAYLWLVEQFCRYRSGTLDKYVALHTKAGARSKGRRFAANESDLFPKGSRRQGDPTFYSKVSNGWFADTNLSHADKFATLMQLSYVCGLEYEVDWNFRVTGATEQLLEHQQSVVGARKALAELLADLDK
jgi:hypothetical protein